MDDTFALSFALTMLSAAESILASERAEAFVSDKDSRLDDDLDITIAASEEANRQAITKEYFIFNYNIVII